MTIISAVQTIHVGVLGLTTSVALQEYFLIALSQPRTEVESSSSDEEGEVEADQELEQLDSPAARMYRKSMVFQQDQKQIREEVTKHKRGAFSIPVCCCAPDLAQQSRVLS
jgi:predicted sugar kinase